MNCTKCNITFSLPILLAVIFQRGTDVHHPLSRLRNNGFLKKNAFKAFSKFQLELKIFDERTMIRNMQFSGIFPFYKGSDENYRIAIHKNREKIYLRKTQQKPFQLSIYSSMCFANRIRNGSKMLQSGLFIKWAFKMSAG